MPTRELTGKDRRYLRALAHDLKPTVQIGNQGLSEGVIKAVDSALTTHELIKVKVAADSSEALPAMGAELAKATKADLAQVIGRILLLFRRRKNKPLIVFPGEKLAKDPVRKPFKRKTPKRKAPERKAPERKAPERKTSQRRRERG